MLVLYDFDSNYVHVKVMPSWTLYQILQSYKRTHKILSVHGIAPLRLQRLDNEAPYALVAFLDDEGVNYQLTPNHSHIRNAAKRTICTWKNHFVSILCGCDHHFKI